MYSKVLLTHSLLRSFQTDTNLSHNPDYCVYVMFGQKQRNKKTTTWQCFGKDSWRLISLRRISDLDLEPSWDVHAVIRCAVALLVPYSCRRISITANPNGVPSRHKRAGSYSVRDVMHFLIRFKEGRGISRSEQISCRRLDWWPEQHSSRQDEQFGMKWN